MSGAVKKNLQELRASIEKNLAKVEERFSSVGTTKNRAAVVSTAKYYTALNKLAKE